MTYIYRCTKCGDVWEASHWNLSGEECAACEAGVYRRDYKAENAAIDKSSLK